MSMEGLLGSVKQQVIRGALAWKPCVNWSSKVGNLCDMFRIINRLHQPSVM